MLDSRKKLILYAVVHNYILTAEPVSSLRLVEQYQLGVSPATVRNELAELEEMGYLWQPHTSAGRIPTDRGYRYYVDSLMGSEGLSPVEKRSIHLFYTQLNKEMEDLMRETSQLLSQLTNYVAVVFGPALRKSSLKHLDLISLCPHSVLMVLITDTGCVAKRVLEMDRSINQRKLSRVERVLNRKLADLNLYEISQKRREFADLLPQQSGLVQGIIDKILDSLMQEERERIYLGGTANILRQPEFESLERIQNLLKTLEQGYILLQLLGEALEACPPSLSSLAASPHSAAGQAGRGRWVSKVIVRIGSENEAVEMQDYSLVATGYHAGGQTLGTLGILGPTRMNYPRAISAVECIAQNLSRILESLHA
ncbi:MAG: heat-inducible transcriptional repressor HrcA [Actinomycetota bacterium]|nr:heat-inducible transcriptional repressor HrcA [Actinomycetota bacterium]MDI6821468.1 heat-inducible transcriptional repressor HrcA [Actinomycetota bacterium]